MPAEILHVMGAVPVASRVAEYQAITLLSGRNVVVMVGGVGGISTVIDSSFVAMFSKFPAPTVNVNVPPVVGTPEITPVVASSVNPVGKLPSWMPHEIGAEPVASRVAVYACPTIASGKDVVIMLTG